MKDSNSKAKKNIKFENKNMDIDEKFQKKELFLDFNNNNIQRNMNKYLS